MSLIPNDADRAYARGLAAGMATAGEFRWRPYPGSTPSPDGDGRALVWIVTPDEMAYIGLRHFRYDDIDGYGWYSGSTREAHNVTHWMPLPGPPWIPGATHSASRSDT